MNWTLWRYLLRKNWLLFLIFYAVFVMYLVSMVALYDPHDMEALHQLMAMYPAELLRAIGFDEPVTDLTGYLASWFYGLMVYGFALVYFVMLANKLVAKKVDNGSFAYFLSTPHSRRQLIFTTGVFVMLAALAMIWAVALTGVAACQYAFPGLLDSRAFLTMNLVTSLNSLAIAMICFFFSCLFNESRHAILAGAGVPLLMLVVQMIAKLSERVAWLKPLSLYAWFEPLAVVRGAATLPVNLAYLALALLLFALSIWVFRRKWLPL